MCQVGLQNIKVSLWVSPLCVCECGERAPQEVVEGGRGDVRLAQAYWGCILCVRGVVDLC